MTDEDELALEEHGAEHVQDRRLVEPLEQHPKVVVLEAAVEEPLDLAAPADGQRVVRQLDGAAGARERLPVQALEEHAALGDRGAVLRHERVQHLASGIDPLATINEPLKHQRIEPCCKNRPPCACSASST